jgi:hypothetical protein
MRPRRGRKTKVVLPEGLEIRDVYKLAEERDVPLRPLVQARFPGRHLPFGHGIRRGSGGAQAFRLHRRSREALSVGLRSSVPGLEEAHDAARGSSSARYAFRDIFSSRLFTALFTASFGPTIVASL